MGRFNYMLNFAYGSNMSRQRLSSRISEAKFYGIGKILDKKLLCNKKSIEGSGKANLVNTPGEIVWGVLYKINDKDIHILDKIEDGYQRQTHKILINEKNVLAELYVSERLTYELPTKSYKKHIVEGAIENQLPLDYIKNLKNIHTID